jgi:Zn-dependent protease with chaperone function
MTGLFARQSLVNPILILSCVLLLPTAAAFCFRHRASCTDRSEQKLRWITYRRWTNILLLAMVAAWWALWDSHQLPMRAAALGWTGANWIVPLLFWLLPIGSVAVIQFRSCSLDRTILGSRWTDSDLLRLSCWRTVCPTVALLLVATGFDAIYDHSFAAVLWLPAAGIIALIGTSRLRSAEGLRMRRVKSGELYRRAYVLAREMRVSLERVYVVPAGRGQLTNAYGLGHSIAVTDNYGTFLKGDQLDFVIGHELGHVKARHGGKKLLTTAAIYAGLALTCLCLPSNLSWLRPAFDICVVFVPILLCCLLSRRFEYAADKAGVELTRAPETAIRALANMQRTTQVPLQHDGLTELFMTHPAFMSRVRAIGHAGGLPADRVFELVGLPRPTTALE